MSHPAGWSTQSPGSNPLTAPIYLEPGKRTISATIGKSTTSEVIEAAEEERLSVALRAFDDAAPNAPEPTTTLAVKDEPVTPARTEVAAPSNRGSGLTIAGLGVAGALAAGSVYFAVKAIGTGSEFDAKKGELGVNRGELDSLQGSARLQVGLSAGLGVGAIGALALTYFVFCKSKSEQPPANATRRTLVVTGTGVVLGGTF